RPISRASVRHCAVRAEGTARTANSNFPETLFKSEGPPMKIHPRMQVAVGALAGGFLMQVQIFAEAPAPVPAAIAAPGEEMVATFHAEGAQLYECKRDSE